jgi:hypothetical protein
LCNAYKYLYQDWGVQQKKANRSSEKNRKKFSAAVAESRLTNDISPESTPGAGRRRARTPHSFPHVKYTTQMSVPEQAELERLRQRINFTDLDEVSRSPYSEIVNASTFKPLYLHQFSFLITQIMSLSYLGLVKYIVSQEI